MKRDIKDILLKSLLYDLDASEKYLLNSWMDENSANTELYKKLKKNHEKIAIDEFIKSINLEKALQDNKKRMMDKGDYSILGKHKKSDRKIIILSLSAAASVIFIFTLLYNINNTQNNVIISHMNETELSHAQITLSTGEKISLGNDTKVNKEIGNSKMSIINNNIAIEKVKSKNKAQEPIISTLTVPHGENYHIVLPDGTRVWLNSLSELKFPNEFEDKREVELKGEAFFEVTKDSLRPFIVKMNDYDVKVKGTSFNISNYSNEEVSRTTLCNGAVDIIVKGERESRFELTPGDQISINHRNKQIKIEEVNTEIYTAWRSGYYYFENHSLEDIFKALSKWYNIDNVDFETNKLRTKLYNGKLQKTDDFVKILTIIEKGADCMIIRDGANLIVAKKLK